MAISHDKVIEVLRSIVHPSSGKDIVSMGLVQNLSLKGDLISFDLNFPSPNDPLKTSIQKACVQAMRKHFPETGDPVISVQAVSRTPAESKEKAVLPFVRNIIAIASGKGGVGKSTVAVNLAVAFAGTGAKVGLIDADIFGPSIPKMLGVEEEKPTVRSIEGKDIIVPVMRYGVKIMSIGFFVNREDATIWRGPMASGALKQLITDTDWGELDYLFIDLPPGTSDIHLTLVQTVSVTGAVIVSTPQAVALADAIKGINMFRNENVGVPVLGLIENMSWFTPEELPQNRYYIFGKDGCLELAEKLNIPLLGQIPIVQAVREASDAGQPAVLRKEMISETYKSVAEKLHTEIIRRNAELDPTQRVEIVKKRISDFKKQSHGKQSQTGNS